MPHYLIKTSLFITLFCILSIAFSRQTPAQELEELQVLRLFYNETDLIVSATRAEKLFSQVAENMTIVSAADIEAMNAHTVADVLDTVVGMQVANSMGPGSLANVMIQGSLSRHVLVMIDGVVQNNLSDMFPDVSAMRVQHIARIEIIKGPASSAWGSSLGGVVNIITKDPESSRPYSGALIASIGERATGDYRAELSGTVGKLGYYLAGGSLLSDGLRSNSAVHGGNVYGKLRWQPTSKSTLTVTLGFDEGARGLSEIPAFVSFDDTFRYFFGTAQFSHRFNDHLKLDLSLKGSTRDNTISYNFAAGGGLSFQGEDSSVGGGARLNWKDDLHNLLLGTDFDFSSLDSPAVNTGSQHLDKWAVYANDTLAFGRFSLTPGIRYDRTNTNGDFLSPSLGATCAIADTTILRAYVARGFNIPPLAFTYAVSGSNPDLRMEKVWSYSAGIETAAVPYLWLKAAYFRHDVTDAMTLTNTSVINEDQRREGVEVEFKTTPVFHTSLSGGFTYIHATNRSTGQVIGNAPRYVYDLGIQYDNSNLFKAALRGRKIDWNSDYPEYSKYSAMIWDFNLSRKFTLSGAITAEAFLTAHNLFNGAQYLLDVYKNPRRWFEGGVRFAF